MMKILTVGWSVWKIATKRFGPAGGFVVAAVVVAGYLLLGRWLKKRHPKLADVVA